MIVIDDITVGGILNGDGIFTTGIHSLLTGLKHIIVSKISFVLTMFLLKSKNNTKMVVTGYYCRYCGSRK